MEVQLAVKGGRPAGSGTPPHRHGDAKPVPNYLRPSAGSCHHVCKYGGTHTFEEKDEPKAQPRPRRPPPVSDNQKMAVIKVRSVSRRRVGDSSRAEKVTKAAIDKEKELERVEWKDILAYDVVSDNIMAKVTGLGDAEKDLMEGKKSYGKAKVPDQVDGFKSENESLDKKLAKSVRTKRTRRILAEPQAANKEASPPHNNTITDGKSVKPPKGKKPTALLVEKKVLAQEMVNGYQILSPSLIQSRANLLRDLEKEMVQEATNVKEGKPTYSLDQEELAAAAESRRPISVHRRVKSMSMSMSSRSVRLPFIRQASKNSSAFKLHSSSTKAPILASEEEKPRRLRSRRGSVAGEDSSSSSTGRGIQLRIRSLRRRGVGGSGGASAGFVVPTVTLRHQKTLEKKKSQRLYNNLIEETASKLVKTRKSKVKALVGAFETVISKIRK
ncbi:hypothetical protein ACP4OV_028177 [Aristida adscensionis]